MHALAKWRNLAMKEGTPGIVTDRARQGESMQRVTSFIPAGEGGGVVAGRVELTHDGRHLRRKALKLEDG